MCACDESGVQKAHPKHMHQSDQLRARPPHRPYEDCESDREARRHIDEDPDGATTRRDEEQRRHHNRLNREARDGQEKNKALNATEPHLKPSHWV